MGYSVVNVHDLPAEGPGGAVRFVRRALGAQAFGINWFEVPPGMAGPEHDAGADGQGLQAQGTRRGHGQEAGERLLRRFDKKFPDFADIISLCVVRLCAHQFRRR